MVGIGGHGDSGRVWPLVLMLAVVAAYLPGLTAPFVFDDAYAVTGNRSIEHLWPPGAMLAPPRDTPVAGRPIVNASLALNRALIGPSPAGFRAVNIAVHVAAALLLAGIVRRTLAGRRLGERYGDAAVPLGYVTALLWALHPLQTEAVTYVTQRSESLAGLCLLATVYCAMRGRAGARAWDLGAVACCTLGMGCKESMVVAPLLVLLHDHAMSGESLRGLLRHRTRLYAGLAGSWCVLAVLMADGPRSGTVGVGLGVGPIEYALHQAVAFWQYLRLAVWPAGQVIDYGPPGEVSPAAGVVAATAAAAAVAGVLVLHHRRPAAGLGLLWFLIALVPTTSVIPIVTEVAAERRTYVALAGLCAVAVVGGYRLTTARSRLAGVGLPGDGRWWVTTGGVLACLAVATARRNLDYRSPVTLWRQAVAARPDNVRALTNLGAALVAAGHPREARPWLVQATRLSPRSPLPRTNLANLDTHFPNLVAAIPTSADRADDPR